MSAEDSGEFGQRYEVRGAAWCDGPHGGLRAFDRHLEREVVINHPYLPQRHDAFLAMVRLRAPLRHVNLVPIYDHGVTEGGIPFFTEPDVTATNLHTLQRDADGTDVTLIRLVAYLLDVCKAVEYLHARGFLNVDPCPWEISVVPQFHEVLVRLPRPILSERHDRSGRPFHVIASTYSAPEQFAGFTEGDVRTDVYRLGAMLFEMLYGDPPDANAAASRIDVINARIRRWETGMAPHCGPLSARAARHPDLAVRLHHVCLRALETELTARQAHVPAFAREIEQCVWGEA